MILAESDIMKGRVCLRVLRMLVYTTHTYNDVRVHIATQSFCTRYNYIIEFHVIKLVMLDWANALLRPAFVRGGVRKKRQPNNKCTCACEELYKY